MRPMSLWESGDSTGEISLSDLFLMPDKIGALNKLTLPMLAFVVCRGGWPKALQKKTEKAALLQQNIIRLLRIAIYHELIM